MSFRKGIMALSPLMVLILFIVMFTVYSVTTSNAERSQQAVQVSLAVAFLFSSIYAIAISRGFSLKKRIDSYSRGASSGNLMLMLWIYVLAGAFAASAKGMGSIDATVNLCINYLPSNLLLPGLFLAACFISLSIGTSVGTIVALVPIAAGIATQTGSSVPLLTAIIVGGAYFGDNLSFISDTTVVATQTQGCEMKEKFHVNVLIVTPAALLMLIVYAFLGAGVKVVPGVHEVDFVKVIPYLVVLITAIAGMNVMAVLTIGIVLCGAIGLITGSFDLFHWFGHISDGILGMGELIIIAMMAGGMLEIVKENGGIDFLIDALTARVKSKRGAELSIAALVSMVNLCTANNTVAILTVGGIAKRIGDKFGVDNRKAASILDTFSCFVQGIIPYGVQMLIAAGLARVNPMEILPYLYYPLAMGVFALASILFRFPRKYSL